MKRDLEKDVELKKVNQLGLYDYYRNIEEEWFDLVDFIYGEKLIDEVGDRDFLVLLIDLKDLKGSTV